MELKLGEENEIDFSLKIEGSEKELVGAKPKIRFTLTEVKSGRGWIFGTQKTKEDQDGVAVIIPDMKNVVSEGESYEGKLEVILGTRYFIPTEVEIKFKEPLKVEAAIVQGTQLQLNEKVTAVIEQEVVPVAVIKERVVRTEKPSYAKLSATGKKAVDRLFLTECKKLGFDNPQKYVKDGTDYTKKRLRALMAKALLEHARLS